ncbi:hypothetical protein VNO80_02803 [Phaseolus coccineus]|uniref:Uncharacterized protein n=1 Tax=Phaseolus coccineus TaxID=3886 RepID=A0AAN9NVP9_PHACN
MMGLIKGLSCLPFGLPIINLSASWSKALAEFLYLSPRASHPHLLEVSLGDLVTQDKQRYPRRFTKISSVRIVLLFLKT